MWVRVGNPPRMKGILPPYCLMVTFLDHARTLQEAEWDLSLCSEPVPSPIAHQRSLNRVFSVATLYVSFATVYDRLVRYWV